MKKIMIQKGNKWKLKNKLEAEDWISIIIVVMVFILVLVNMMR